VGDPKQAINTTFTNANPRFLRDFLGRREREGSQVYEGRAVCAPTHRSSPPPRGSGKPAIILWMRCTSAFMHRKFTPHRRATCKGNPATNEAADSYSLSAGTKQSRRIRNWTSVASSVGAALAAEQSGTEPVRYWFPKIAGLSSCRNCARARHAVRRTAAQHPATRDAAQRLHTALVYLAAPNGPTTRWRRVMFRNIWWPHQPGRR